MRKAAVSLSAHEDWPMSEDSFALPRPDGVSLHVRRWLPGGPPRAVMQIVHGLAEHAGRYARFATTLTAAGYAVYADDHRGHGLTATSPADLGFFAERDGWATVLADLDAVAARARGDHPGLPLLLFGHSMGSFLVQCLIGRSDTPYAAAVLSGSNGKPPAMATLGRLIARVERWRLGPRGRSKLIHSLSFETLNARFKPNRTTADWLSRDAAEVDRFVADPLCGFVPTAGLWRDLLDAMARHVDATLVDAIPKRLPILVASGGDDPVSDKARGLDSLMAAYRAAGLARVDLKIWPGARHEPLNETNRDEVTADLLAWFETVLATKAA